MCAARARVALHGRVGHEHADLVGNLCLGKVPGASAAKAGYGRNVLAQQVTHPSQKIGLGGVSRLAHPARVVQELNKSVDPGAVYRHRRGACGMRWRGARARTRSLPGGWRRGPEASALSVSVLAIRARAGCLGEATGIALGRTLMEIQRFLTGCEGTRHPS